MARILIVDDDDDDRVWLTAILEGAGHAAVAARDGDEALEAFLAQPIHLVVTDMVMPGRGGLGLMSALKEIDPRAAIIAISGKSPGQLEASKVFGARSVLRKPIDKDELLGAVRTILGSDDEGDA